MTALPRLRCHWSESFDGVHVLCPLEATFSVPVSWEVEDGIQMGHVALCVLHAMQATKEGITKS